MKYTVIVRDDEAWDDVAEQLYIYDVDYICRDAGHRYVWCDSNADIYNHLMHSLDEVRGWIVLAGHVGPMENYSLDFYEDEVMYRDSRREFGIMLLAAVIIMAIFTGFAMWKVM